MKTTWRAEDRALGGLAGIYPISNINAVYDIDTIHRGIREARVRANLTQRELAERIGTTQAVIAKLERGGSNPTIDTLTRCAAGAGFSLSVHLAPLTTPDAVVDRYKRDVDRSLLRENLKKSVDERLRTLSEWQEAGRALERATKRAKTRKSRRA